jgi:hypothetical protein
LWREVLREAEYWHQDVIQFGRAEVVTMQGLCRHQSEGCRRLHAVVVAWIEAGRPMPAVDKLEAEDE